MAGRSRAKGPPPPAPEDPLSGGARPPAAARKGPGERLADALRAAALAVSSADGDELHRELMRCLATLLDVDVAFIAVFIDESRTRVRTLACWLDGRFVRNFDYALAGSPCAAVVGRAFRFVASGVNPEFPAGTMFRALGMDSYAAIPLSDAAGAPLGLIGVMDRAPMPDRALPESILTIFAARASAEIERQRAVAALADSEASYRTIFEASEDTIFVHDPETGAILDASPKSVEAFGYTADELRTMSVADISANTGEYTLAEARRRIDEARAGRPIRFEWLVRHRDGQLMWHEVRLKRAIIAGRLRVLAFTRDVTANRMAEDALRASEAQYRAIFNASEDALVLWNSRLERVDVNAAYERMFGYSREETLNRPNPHDLPPAEAERRRDLVRRTLQGERCHVEVESIRRGGERFHAEIRTIPTSHRGEPHALAIVRDITARKAAETRRAELESQLRQAQKMEAIGHLTGGIAHDFNNLLTSIAGYVALAAEHPATEDPRLARYLDQAGRSCERAGALVQQMLAFSRGRPIERRPLALLPLVTETLALLRASLPPAVRLREAGGGVAVTALVDPVQLEQVLMNLALNARDAMPNGGTLDVRVKEANVADQACASCRAPVAGCFAELEVTDSGPGIAAAVQERMFEPFFSTKDVGRGTGMGLAMVHGIVHDHGGHVLVETGSSGSRFRVLLPALEPGEPEAARAGDARATSSRAPLSGRVLVVDDEESVATFMTDLLTGWGLEVTTERDPETALARLRGGRAGFDVLLTDQSMPGMSGIELAQAVTAMRTDVRVLLYSGHGDAVSEPMQRAAGVRELLQKPVDPGRLHRALASALDERRRG